MSILGVPADIRDNRLPNASQSQLVRPVVTVMSAGKQAHALPAETRSSRSFNRLLPNKHYNKDTEHNNSLVCRNNAPVGINVSCNWCLWYDILFVPIPVPGIHIQIDAASQASSKPARQRERERERAWTGDCRARGLNPPRPHLLQFPPPYHPPHITFPGGSVPKRLGLNTEIQTL